jgi:CDP-diacylglycerol--glycerol-3-phosphate 3-phosphatidyltransferase
MRIMLAQKQDTIAASFYGKAKTATQMFALAFLIANMTLQQESIAIMGNILLYIALILTVFSGADYIIKGYKKHLR